MAYISRRSHNETHAAKAHTGVGDCNVLRRVPSCGFAERERILDCLARSLPEVRLHRMGSVPSDDDTPFAKAARSGLGVDGERDEPIRRRRRQDL